MIIVFPMAGLSSRFFKAGYKKPKYMLNLNGESVFSKAVLSFKKYFNEVEFLFIFRNLENTKEFIKQECEKMGLHLYKLVELEKETQGQAHTVMLGLRKAKVGANESLLIFNIDTFRPNFSLPPHLELFDGYLEVFEGEGEQWSFVLPDENGRVLKTAEKERISKLCSTGLYYFKRARAFKETFLELQNKNQRSKNEFYIAPMYNTLIKKGALIGFVKIDLSQVIFCGTPLEYENLLKQEEFK